MITAIGGWIIRDVMLDSRPPATFSDWRYLAVAAGGGLIAIAFGRRLDRLNSPINLPDVLIRQIPSVLSSGLYAIPALLGATAIVVASD